MKKVGFTTQERTVTLLCAAIFSLRMLGLFMIMPVFAMAAQAYPQATPALIGLAMGGYGLTQAGLQIPLGMLSDYWGRKPVILLGLCLFILGSMLAAYATGLVGVIIGRLLQGAGAIGCVVSATLADHTRDSVRTRAMAGLGASIGLAFGVAVLVGPWLYQRAGLAGIFGLTAVLGCIALGLVLTGLPSSIRVVANQSKWRTQLGDVLRFPALWPFFIGIFCLHATLSAMFVFIPTQLANLGWHGAQLNQFYVPTLLPAFVFALGLIVLAERKREMGSLQTAAIGWQLLVSVLYGVYFINQASIGLAAFVFSFFTSFSVLEASLQAQVSQVAPKSQKGTALGVYSSCQFLGIFVGSSMAGSLQQWFQGASIVGLCIGLQIIWIAALGWHKARAPLSAVLSR